jgi:hypothetical protein
MSNKYFLVLTVTLLVVASYAWASAQTGVIINPHGVDYPLTRTTRYQSRKGDPYETAFGVRRWLNPIDTPGDPDFKQTVLETYDWHKVFGGYGVIGHGEDVFTRRGAQFRRTHRGR